MGTTILYLLPCPECKGPVSAYRMILTRYGTQYAIACVDRHCGVTTGFCERMTLDEVAVRWNTGIGLTRAGTPIGQASGQMMAVEVACP